jgi:6-phosphogluconolactonase
MGEDGSIRVGARDHTTLRRGTVRLLVVVGMVALAGAGTAVAQQPAFAPVPGSPFATGLSPVSLAFNPDGRSLATANKDGNSVSVFAVSQGGALRPVAGSPFGITSPRSLAFSPTEALLASVGHGGATMFSVSPEGALSPVAGSPFAAGSIPTSVAIRPDGRLLAIANSDSDDISVFSVAAGGSLTPSPGSPFKTLKGSRPFAVAFSPGGNLLAVTNYQFHAVSMYSVSSDGALSQAPGSPYNLGMRGAGPTSVTFSPDGRLLATANFVSSTVSEFSVAADGKLNQVDGSPFRAGFLAESVAFSPDERLLATANEGDDNVSLFTVSPFGGLTPLGSPLATGRRPKALAFNRAGTLLAVANGTGNSVSVFGAATGPTTGGRTGRAVGLRQTASSTSITAGGSVRFALTITNSTWTAMRDARTCDALPTGLVLENASPSPRRIDGRLCWTLARLASGRRKTYTLAARALLSTRGALTNHATATAAGATTSESKVTVHVAPGSGRG